MPTPSDTPSPWEVCPECRGAGVTECGRFTSQQQAPDFPCDRCGGTGLARLRDPEGCGRLLFARDAAPVRAHHQRLADDLVADMDAAVLTLKRHERGALIARFLADYEAFLRSGPA